MNKKINLTNLPIYSLIITEKKKKEKNIIKKKSSGLDHKGNVKTCRTQAPNPKPHPNIRLIHEDRPKINQEWFIEIVRPCLALRNHFLAASKCPLSLGRHSLASRKHYLAPRKCLIVPRIHSLAPTKRSLA